jgi:AP-3 complex subunit beta
VDEWGQVTIINMLTRYARNQFCNPHTASESNNNINKQQQEDTLEEEDEDPENEDFDAKFNIDGRSKVLMDPDHRLLLKVTKPLLQSRNSAVVLSVAQLYYYVAPKSEVQFVTKALVRLLRSYREVQIIVLKNIVSMAQKNQQMFQAHQKSFYVHSNDSIQVKILKLEILTCLANETNISIILREFQV